MLVESLSDSAWSSSLKLQQYQSLCQLLTAAHVVKEVGRCTRHRAPRYCLHNQLAVQVEVEYNCELLVSSIAPSMLSSTGRGRAAARPLARGAGLLASNA